MDIPKARDRIKKLRALANNTPSAKEAQTALGKAKGLAAKLKAFEATLEKEKAKESAEEAPTFAEAADELKKRKGDLSSSMKRGFAKATKIIVRNSPIASALADRLRQ